MAKACGVLNSLYHICGRTERLNRCILINEQHDSVEIRWMCQQHAKEFIDNTIYDEKNIKMMIDIHQQDHEKHKEFLVKAEVGYDSKREVGYEATTFRQKQEKEKKQDSNLKEKLKNIRWGACRHEMCRGQLFDNQVKCTLIIMSTKNKFRYAFYYHRSCFDKIRARLGIILPIQTGQFTLDSIPQENLLKA